VEQSNAKGPSRNPSGVRVVEFGKHVFGVVAAVLRNGKDAHDDSKDTGECPEDGKSLFPISNFSSNSSEESHIKPRQPSVSKRRHQVAKNCDTKEDQIDLPAGTSKDADIRFGLKHVDACTKKERSGEVDGEGDGNVADYKSPTANPRSDSAIRWWCQHEGLVVHTATGWVDARNLTERCGYAEND
jgi:hypothetical protein